jgi:hypothetical protein
MATLDDLAQATASLLGITAVGLPLSAEDADEIKSIARNLFRELDAVSVYTLPDEDDIPEEAVIPLSQRVALDCLAPFGVQATTLAALGVTMQSAEYRLRRLSLDVEKIPEIARPLTF